jgi:hypothetical protein
MKTVWSLIGSERMSSRHFDVSHEGDDCITALMRFCEAHIRSEWNSEIGEK